MQQRWIHREPTASTLFPECHQGGYSMCRVVGRPKNEPPLSQATGMRLRGPVGVCLSQTPSHRLTNRFSATLKISPASSRCAHACKLVLRKNSLPHTSQWLFPRENTGPLRTASRTDRESYGNAGHCGLPLHIQVLMPSLRSVDQQAEAAFLLLDSLHRFARCARLLQP